MLATIIFTIAVFVAVFCLFMFLYLYFKGSAKQAANIQPNALHQEAASTLVEKRNQLSHKPNKTARGLISAAIMLVAFYYGFGFNKNVSAFAQSKNFDDLFNLQSVKTDIAKINQDSAAKQFEEAIALEQETLLKQEFAKGCI